MPPNFNFLMSKMEKNPSLRKRKTLTRFLVVGKSKLSLFTVLVEMESRKLLEHETIVVMDDIADSFDYYNKVTTKK